MEAKLATSKKHQHYLGDLNEREKEHLQSCMPAWWRRGATVTFNP